MAIFDDLDYSLPKGYINPKSPISESGFIGLPSDEGTKKSSGASYIELLPDDNNEYLDSGFELNPLPTTSKKGRVITKAPSDVFVDKLYSGAKLPIDANTKRIVSGVYQSLVKGFVTFGLPFPSAFWKAKRLIEWAQTPLDWRMILPKAVELTGLKSAAVYGIEKLDRSADKLEKKVKERVKLVSGSVSNKIESKLGLKKKFDVRNSSDQNELETPVSLDSGGMVSLPAHSGDPIKDESVKGESSIVARGASKGKEPIDVTEYSNSNFAFQGRKTVEGLTIHSTHLWDVKLEPWEFEGYTIVPDLQSRLGKDEDGTSNTEGEKNSTPNNSYVPVVSYTLNYKTLTSKTIDLYQGTSIAIPEAIRMGTQLSLQIVDDETRRWRKYFQLYAERMYDMERNLVTPYKNSIMKVTIYNYRSDRQVLTMRKFLCVLKDYNVEGSGQSSESALYVDVEFSIVGELSDTNKYTKLG